MRITPRRTLLLAVGKRTAVYDAQTQKCYNVTGTRKGLLGIPLTLNGQPIFAGTPHMHPVTGNQKNVVEIEMQGLHHAQQASFSVGLLSVVKAQGLKNNKPLGTPGITAMTSSPTLRPPLGTCTIELVKNKAHKDTFVQFDSCDQVDKHTGQTLYS